MYWGDVMGNSARSVMVFAAAIGAAAAMGDALQPLGVVGPVQDAAPFYRQLLKSSLPDRTESLSAADSARVQRWSGFALYDSGLPQRRFDPRTFSPKETRHLQTPICLIANDRASVTWLRQVKPVLKAQKAVCYLVKTTSEHDEQALRAIIPSTPVVALNPSLVIQKLDVPGYPALISRAGVEQ